MRIQLKDSPIPFSAQGARDYNQDALFPPEAPTPDQAVYVVCDGVGGGPKGDVAAQKLSMRLGMSLLERLRSQPDTPLTLQDLQLALQTAEAEMLDYKQQQPEADTMATTLTVLALDAEGALVGWVGDSRVYQFRKNSDPTLSVAELKLVTQDHSVVNELVQKGELSPEQAAEDPRRNMLKRAITGADRPAELDALRITDIRPNDVFLLCTDGVLEGVPDDRQLAAWAQYGADYLSNQIIHACKQGPTPAHDNFSFYALQVQAVSPTPPQTPPKALTPYAAHTLGLKLAETADSPAEPRPSAQPPAQESAAPATPSETTKPAAQGAALAAENASAPPTEPTAQVSSASTASPLPTEMNQEPDTQQNGPTAESEPASAQPDPAKRKNSGGNTVLVVVLLLALLLGVGLVVGSLYFSQQPPTNTQQPVPGQEAPNGEELADDKDRTSQEAGDATQGSETNDSQAEGQDGQAENQAAEPQPNQAEPDQPKQPTGKPDTDYLASTQAELYASGAVFKQLAFDQQAELSFQVLAQPQYNNLQACRVEKLSGTNLKVLGHSPTGAFDITGAGRELRVQVQRAAASINRYKAVLDAYVRCDGFQNPDKLRVVVDLRNED